MTSTMIHLERDELDALKEATTSRFGSDSRISRGGMVLLMAQETIDEYGGSDE
jgi:hypothetical protein